MVPKSSSQVEASESRIGVRQNRHQQWQQWTQNSRSYSCSRQPNGHQESTPANRKNFGKVKTDLYSDCDRLGHLIVIIQPIDLPEV